MRKIRIPQCIFEQHAVRISSQRGRPLDAAAAGAMRIATASLSSIRQTKITEPSDARQSQRPLSHHRRVDRRCRGARLQSLSTKKEPEGLQINVGPEGLKIKTK